MGSQLARGLGIPGRAVSTLASVMRAELNAQAAQLAESRQDPSQGSVVTVFKFDQTKAPAFTDDPISSDTAVAGGCWGEGC